MDPKFVFSNEIDCPNSNEASKALKDGATVDSDIQGSSSCVATGASLKEKCRLETGESKNQQPKEESLENNQMCNEDKGAAEKYEFQMKKPKYDKFANEGPSSSSRILVVESKLDLVVVNSAMKYLEYLRSEQAKGLNRHAKTFFRFGLFNKS